MKFPWSEVLLKKKKGTVLRYYISTDEEMPQRLSIYPGICKRFFLLFIFVIYIPAVLRGLEVREELSWDWHSTGKTVTDIP